MKSLNKRQCQRGLSLIETMVGITVGLLTVLAAVGTLMVTRQGSTTVSESYRLASAGNTAMRLIAATIRQGGAAELDQTVVGGPVSFGTLTLRASGAGGDQLVTGTEGASGAPDTLIVSYEHRDATVTRDCLGNSPGAPPERIDNTFSVTTVELRCVGNRGSNGSVIGGGAQALVGDNANQNTQIAVEDFQVWYWVINAAGQQRRVTANNVVGATPLGWPAVDAVEICLQLRGTATNYPTANFTNCAGTSVANGGRLHQVLRGVYKLRNRV
jgi:type IV pilus assembly protein PilW